MMQKRSRIIAFTLIFLGFTAVAVYLFCCTEHKKTASLNYVLQGTTTLSQNTIKMKIWDNNTEDGDSVKVYLDGRLIKDSIALMYEPLEINFGKLGKGEHLLGVAAITEGANAPATATISLGNEIENKDFEMNATLDSAASWKIIIQ